MVDNGYFPPKAVVVVSKGDDVFLFTLGMSLLQQPSVEIYSQYPEGLRRTELAMGIRKELFEKHRDGFIAYLVGLSDIPWNYTTFLADGHTVLFDIEPFKKVFTNALLLDGEVNFSEKLYGRFRGDAVNNLWVVPITETEQHYAEELGNEALMKNALDTHSLRIFDGKDPFGPLTSPEKKK